MYKCMCVSVFVYVYVGVHVAQGRKKEASKVIQSKKYNTPKAGMQSYFACTCIPQISWLAKGSLHSELRK